MKINVFGNIFNEVKTNSEDLANEKKTQILKKKFNEYAIDSWFWLNGWTWTDLHNNVLI